MWRYLRAAFLARIAIPGLGGVPVNLLAVGAFAALGLVHPGFWVVGAACEAAFLLGLSTNDRFRRAVDASLRPTATSLVPADAEAQRRALVAQLNPPARARMAALSARCARAVELARPHDPDGLLLDANRDAFDRLQYLYLRLLLASQVMQAQDAEVTGSQLRRQIDQLRAELDAPAGSEAARRSKAATLQIVERRLELWQRRGQALAEVEADLERIDAQVELAIENASLSGRPAGIAGTLTLASDLMTPGLFGESESTVAALDRAYHIDGPQHA